MTLKELYELNTPNRTQDIIGDYLNKPAEYRAVYNFEDYLEELYVCSECGDICERDDMTYHAWDIGNTEDLICESCRNDEAI